MRPIGAPSVRPGTSTFPDTLATSPDTVRKAASRNPRGHQELSESRPAWSRNVNGCWVASAPYPPNLYGLGR
jgi:hypothetical protein